MSTKTGEAQTQRVVDPGRGVVLSERDENLLVTEYQYDGFGRLRGTQSPSGLATGVSYAWDAATKRMTVTKTANDGSMSRTYSDPLGRERLRESKNFSGGTSRVVTAYDPASRVISVTEPFVSGIPNEARTSYDGRGRVVSTCLHTGGSSTPRACERMKYRLQHGAPDTVEVTDPSGRMTKTERDTAGRIAATTIHTSIRPGSCDLASNTSAARTTFGYGPFDLLASSKYDTSHTVSIEYDTLGRRKRLIDPDTGRRTFQYDGSGNLRTETDATNRLTVFSYDYIGRLVRRASFPADPDGDATFTYDTATGLGRGKLASSRNAVALREYSYTGPAGALDRSTITGADTKTVQLTYDGLGRLLDTTYPAAPGREPFITRNVYNPSGYLSEIQQASQGGWTIWRATAADAANRLTGEEMNHARMKTTLMLDPVTRKVAGITTRDVSDVVVQSSQYAYCKNGNLASRSSLVPTSQIETFEYDDANRLVQAGVTNGLLRTWRYDAIGNITSTNEPGLTGCAWAYGEGAPSATSAPGPHALTSLRCGASTYSFGYDANGNMTSSPTIPALTTARTMTFGPAKVSRVTTNGLITETVYDAAGNRSVKQGIANQLPRIEYFDDLFERRRYADGTQDHVYLVHALGRPVMQYVWNWNGTAGAGTTRFLHVDAQGSPEIASSSTGHVVDRVSFDAWGKRRDPSWLITTQPATPSLVKLGFEGNNHDDELGLIDMGGRNYDPILKRFISADPFVQAPFYGPSYNRYSYVFNNPLKFGDPTGYRASLLTPNRLNGGVLSRDTAYSQGWGLLEGFLGIAMTQLDLWRDMPSATDFFGDWSGNEDQEDTVEQLIARVQRQIAIARGHGATDLDPQDAALIVADARPQPGGGGSANAAKGKVYGHYEILFQRFAGGVRELAWYIGKGPPQRAIASALRILGFGWDPLEVRTALTATERKSFVNEHDGIEATGGPRSKQNLNKIASPGKKLAERASRLRSYGGVFDVLLESLGIANRAIDAGRTFFEQVDFEYKEKRPNKTLFLRGDMSFPPFSGVPLDPI